LPLNEAIRRLLARFGRTEQTPRPPVRGRVDHVIIIDGTMSSLEPGWETNAGLTYKLLREVRGSRMSIRYEAGVQWQAWRSTIDVIEGRGINRQIRRVYGFLASRYRPGDRIFLFGYSRGAYAVRSLAGVIDRVGLLRAEHATERNVEIAYRHYRRGTDGAAHRAFVKRFCHEEAPVEMVGVWDTVKALGFRAPVVWKYTEERHAFHNHALGTGVRRGFHALALHERREVYAPVLWTLPEGWAGEMEQVWFRGTHGDVGGQIAGFEAARPLSNIPLVWMLGKAEACGLELPEGWRARFPCDPDAPSVGSMRGWGKFFVLRRRRVVGTDPSEAIHPTAELPGREGRLGWPVAGWRQGGA
jgi:uncharacterized protein (DUF2235 family)